MKGWFTPYRVLNVAGIVFLAMRILMHVVWLNAWANYTVLVVVALTAATQIMRNVNRTQATTPMSMEVSAKRVVVHITTAASPTDVFNSMGRNSPNGTIAYTIPIRSIGWMSTSNNCTKLHLSDGSTLSGKTTKSDLDALKNAMMIVG